MSNTVTPNKLQQMSSADGYIVVCPKGDYQVEIKAFDFDGALRGAPTTYVVANMSRLVQWCINHRVVVECPISTLIECLHAAGELFTVASNGAAVAVEHNCFTHVGLPVDTEAALAICARLGIEVIYQDRQDR